ncbi:MAG TPA: hypothetical protein VFQ53_07450 [Kofleriaceae bacterium]|nr:hypothetical protein [Kofleriaceae bacterium]
MKRFALTLALAACGEVHDPGAGDDAPPALAVHADGRHFVRLGGQLVAPITVERNAASGPVAVSIANLPAGVTADPVEIAADATTGELVLHADPAAAFARLALDVTATAGDATATAPLDVEVIGRPGTLDPTVGTGGVQSFVASDKDETPQFAIAQDDRLVIGVSVRRNGREGLLVIRRGRDGAADPTFGAGGEAYFDLGAAGFTTGISVRALAQPDGKIVIAGSGSNGTDGDLFLVRITADGQVDPAMPLGTLDGSTLSLSLSALALAPDGGIVLAGTRSFQDNSDGFVLRTAASGTRDATFGSDGLALVDTIRFDTISGVAVQEDGRVVVLGSVSSGAEFEIPRAVLRRLGVDGQLDPAFGDAGVAVLPTPESFAAGNALVSPDRRQLVVAGAVRQSFATADLGIWRYTADGQLDPGFAGGTGYYAEPATTTMDAVQRVEVAADGSIYGIGLEADNFGEVARLSIVHLDAAGNPDPGFGDAGIVRDTATDMVRATALRDDFRLIVVGSPLLPSDTNDSSLRSYWR